MYSMMFGIQQLADSSMSGNLQLHQSYMISVVHGDKEPLDLVKTLNILKYKIRKSILIP